MNITAFIHINRLKNITFFSNDDPQDPSFNEIKARVSRGNAIKI